MIRLRELRKTKKITMKELGKAIGVAESTVSFYELGKREPDYSTLIKIANYFNVPIDFLLENGVFSNWEVIKKYKKPIIATINQLMDCNLYEEDMSDTDFIRIINSAFAKIDINSDGVIDAYPLLPISEFKKIPLQLKIVDKNNQNVKNGKDRMTDGRSKVIADTLNTTPAYLNDETDKREKPATTIDDGLTEEQKEIIDLFDRADPILQRAALAMLRTAETDNKDPDDV